MSDATPTQVSFPGITATLEPPRLLARKQDYFWRPTLAVLGRGELLALVNTHSDQFVTANTADVLCSQDNGRTWGHPWPLAPAGWVVGPGAHEESIFILPYNAIYFADRSRCALMASRVTVARGGHAISTELGAVQVSLPRPVATTNAYLQPQQRTLARFEQPVMFFWGHPVSLPDGALVTTMFGAWADAPTFRNVIVVRSHDGGRRWDYIGTVAQPEHFDCTSGGCAESSLVLLEDGALLCIFRVNGAQPEPDPSYGRAISGDGGRTWSRPTLLAPNVGRVDPHLRRLSNGILALIGGRPGFSVWFATDGRGETWHELDLLAHHNGHVPRSPIRAVAHHRGGTSSYGGIVEVTPNRLLIAYDRLPGGWDRLPPGADEWNEVYTISLGVERAG